MIIKKLGVFSIAKISGITYAAMGLIIGFIFAFISMVAGSIFEQSDMSGGLFAMAYGAGAIFFLPFLYGMLGFIGGAIMAWVYNVVARFFGGIEMKVEFEPSDYPAETS